MPYRPAVSALFGLSLLATTSPARAQFCGAEDRFVGFDAPALEARAAARAHESGAGALHAVAMESSLWRPGSAIRVRLIGGQPSVRAAVRRFADEWTRHANLDFDWVSTGAAEIRVTFTPGGSWSRVGETAPSTSDAPTMNFGWFSERSSEASLRKTIQHEFGHALGLSHEHQNPADAIRWNKPLVLADLKRTQGWDAVRVEHNVFRRLAVSSVRNTRFDGASIMGYSIPSRWTLDGQGRSAGSKLSSLDKSFVAELYPGRGAPAPVPAPTAAPTRRPPSRPPNVRPRVPPPDRRVPFVRVRNAAVRTGERTPAGAEIWAWTAYLDGPEIADVVAVTYHLHPSFPDSVRRVTQSQGGRFPLSARGWGTFPLRAHYRLKDGHEYWEQHTLQFAGAPAVVPGLSPGPAPAPVVVRAPKVSLTNSSQRLDAKRFRWTAFLQGDVDAVADVTYVLHPTFRKNRIRVTRGAERGFPFTTTGWGTFEIKAEVRWKQGGGQTLRHMLRFR